LKLENILFEKKGSSIIKIVDFGIAGLSVNLNSDNINMGSLRYMAPEVLQGKMK
jgi:MAP/microtubule affinity-regulating kinase